MRKNLTFLLSTIAMFSLVSCGGSTKNETTEKDSPKAETKNELATDKVVISQDDKNLIFTITGPVVTEFNKQIETLNAASKDDYVTAKVNFYNTSKGSFYKTDNNHGGYITAIMHPNGVADMSLFIAKDKGESLPSSPMEKGANFTITKETLVLSAPTSFYEGLYGNIIEGEVSVTDIEHYVVHSSEHKFTN